MIGWILERSIRFRLLVIPLAAGLMVVGIARLRDAPVDVLPEYTLPYVEVQTESLGLSAAEVEQLITVPMEQDLLVGVKGVETIRSDSVPGLSSVVMVFERGTDILRARQLVQERLTQAHALPNVSKPPQMLQPVSSTSRVMMVSLSSRRLSPIQLSVLARWTVRPRLMGLHGVANVAIWGHRDRQLQVRVDPERLRARRVSLQQIIRTTGNAQLVSPLSFLDASTPGTGGFIDGPNQRLGVRHVLPFGRPADLAQVPIERTGLRLGDVATVTEDHQPLIGDAVVRGGRGGLLLVVEKLPGANTLEVTRELDGALDEMRPGLSGVRIDSSIFRPATYIEEAIDNLALALMLGAVLVVLALVAFLFRWRSVLVGAVAIPASLVTALLVLDLTGATMNALVVTGLLVAIAVVVDDAVIDVENVGRRLRAAREGASGASPTAVLLAAAGEMRSAMGYATLIALLVMVPVFFLKGLSGAFVHPLAVSYALAVGASMVVALTLTPALGATLLVHEPREGRESPLARRLTAACEGLLRRISGSPRPALLAAGGAVLLAVALLPWLGQSLPPSFKDRDLLVRWHGASGTSLPEMSRVTARAGAELRSLPGIRDVGAHVGRAVTSDLVDGTDSGEMWVSIDRNADYDGTVASVRRVVAGYPGLRGEVLTYERARSANVLRSGDDSAVVRLYGENYGVLRRKAEEMRRVLSRVEGIPDPRVAPEVRQPTLQIEVDLAAARREGIKPGDVRRAAATLLAGLEVGSFFEQQKVFQVVVWGVDSTRRSVDSVRDLLIDTPDGDHVRLGRVARVRIEPNAADIRHEAVSRYMDVRAQVHGRDLGDVKRDVKRRLRDVSFPLEYHAELLDRPAGGERGPGLLTLAIAAGIGIFLLLQAAFGSWRLAGLLTATLPVALAGGVVVAFLRGGDLSLGELVGLVAVLVLALRQGVVLIRSYQALEREGGARGTELVVRGTRARLPAILTSAAAIAAAVLPFALMGDVAGNELTHPMALVILGGLVTSALLAVFILPALYLHYGAGSRQTPAPPEPVPVTPPDQPQA